MYICVCVPQPILIAPRGPHRFIPSGEGASPSPFGPLNARGCVHEPPCGGPPWPPLLPGPRKTKNQPHTSASYTTRFCRVRIIFFETFRPCVTYICKYACHRLCVNFVDVSHLFSRNLRRKGVSHFFSGKFHTFFLGNF